jgi:CBS domain-containing protein
MLVSELVQSSPVTIAAKTSAENALRVATERSAHYLLVVDGAQELVGVVCVCELSEALAADAVARRMRPPAFVALEDALDQVEAVMQQCGTGCVVVLDDDGVLRGVLTHDALRRGLGREAEPACFLCGSTENLKVAHCVEAPRFCAVCLEQAPHSAPISF